MNLRIGYLGMFESGRDIEGLRLHGSGDSLWEGVVREGGPVAVVLTRVLASNGDGAGYGGVSLDGAKGVAAAQRNQLSYEFVLS